jgi:hypothetical protein
MKKITLFFALVITSLGFSQNLITNGNFENGITGWSGNAANVVTVSGNSYNAANVVTATPNEPYNVNLSYTFPMLTSGTAYKLTFTAWSNGTRPLIAGIGLYQDPWTNVTQTVTLGMTSQTYVLFLTSNFANANSRIIFDMGGAVGTVNIDNVILEYVTPPTPTCTDGIQNGTETGIDCGGSCPNVCLTQVNLPINYQGNTINYAVTDFGDCASTKVIDPTDASNTNMVIKTIKPLSAPLWGGTTMSTTAGFSSPIPFTASNRKMYVRVWSPDAGIPVRLKVEVVGNPTQSCETQTNTTVANGWQVMEFDFNNQASGTAAFNPAYVFNMASIFFNFGTDGATAGSKTYYFDNVSYGTALGINDFNENSFKMYPNPATNDLTVSGLSTIENVAVYNLLGQEVINKRPNSNEVTLDVSNLQNGVYIIKTLSDGKIASSKFVKE